LRIAFDARVLAPGRVGGTRTYALQLLRALAAARPGWELVLYLDEPLEGAAFELLSAGNVRAVVLAARRNPAWVQLDLARALRHDGADLFHSPGYFLPLGWRGPSVVSAHDTNMYRHPGRRLRRGRVAQWLDLAVQTPPALLRADRVITISQASARSLRRLLPPISSRIRVTPLAPDTFFDGKPSEADADVAAELTGPGPYLLAVGAVSPEKRLSCTLEAFAAAARPDGTTLVLAGPDEMGYAARLTSLAADLGIGEALRVTGPVSDGILRALYAGAAALVMAADAEGFGLPVVEAMACGTPVLAASRGALPEVLAGAGWLFDPDRAPELGSLMSALIADPAQRAELSARSRRRRRDFSWERTAALSIAVYEEVTSR
jgi:alpha-1,3-rhamnosyl/mannosyltransferase